MGTQRAGGHLQTRKKAFTRSLTMLPCWSQTSSLQAGREMSMCCWSPQPVASVTAPEPATEAGWGQGEGEPSPLVPRPLPELSAHR